LTLAAILVEVADDIRMMPAIMLTLSVANLVADKLAPSFDEAMMKLQGLPYLDEAPPQGLSMLTAQNAMASPVIVLPEVAQISFIAGILDNTTHNGFPVVRLDHVALHSADADQATVMRSKAKFCGMILRRQLLVLLQERVWEFQEKDRDPPQKAIERYVGSFSSFADADLLNTKTKVATFCKLTSADMSKLLDLRSFMDPSPLTVGKLMPLSRVYRLFNEIGVRHLPVLDPQYRLSGIITRKDLHIENMEATILRLADLSQDITVGGNFGVRRTTGQGGPNRCNPDRAQAGHSLDTPDSSFCASHSSVNDAARRLRGSTFDDDDYEDEDDASQDAYAHAASLGRPSRASAQRLCSDSSFQGNELHPSCGRLISQSQGIPNPSAGRFGSDSGPGGGRLVSIEERLNHATTQERIARERKASFTSLHA